MILSLSFQAEVFVISILCGMMCSAFYDILRLLRIYKRHGALLTSLEDIIYWVICVFFFFTVMLKVNGGQMRLFIPGGFFIGLVFYLFTLGKVVIRAAERIINVVIYIINVFFDIITTPFRLIWLVIKKPIVFLCNSLSKVLILKVKYVKILCNTKKDKYSSLLHKQKGNGKLCQEKQRGKKKNRFQIF